MCMRAEIIDTLDISEDKVIFRQDVARLFECNLVCVTSRILLDLHVLLPNLAQSLGMVCKCA